MSMLDQSRETEHHPNVQINLVRSMTWGSLEMKTEASASEPILALVALLQTWHRVN